MFDYVLKWWNIIDWLIDPNQHILISCFGGVFVYEVVSSILFIHALIIERLTNSRMKLLVVYSIIVLSVLISIYCGLVVYHSLGSLWEAYSAPLNPPLNLRVPNT